MRHTYVIAFALEVFVEVELDWRERAAFTLVGIPSPVVVQAATTSTAGGSRTLVRHGDRRGSTAGLLQHHQCAVAMTRDPIKESRAHCEHAFAFLCHEYGGKQHFAENTLGPAKK